MTAELNQHMEFPVSIKSVRRHLHKQNISSRAEIPSHLSHMLIPNVIYSDAKTIKLNKLISGDYHNTIG